MPCLNAELFLEEALDTVLCQSEVLEVLVADGGSTDTTLSILTRRALVDSRLRLVSSFDLGPADALNKAISQVRGTIIGWLNADDRYLPGAAARALQAFDHHPQWLLVYGEAEHIDELGVRLDSYPSRLPDVGLLGFADYCFICQPTVFWRRSLAVMLGLFDTSLQTCFDFDYWIRAFRYFPERIGHIPCLQAQTRRHKQTISTRLLPRAVLEATLLQSRLFAANRPHLVQSYINAIVAGTVALPAETTRAAHADQLAALALELAIPPLQFGFITSILDCFRSEDSRSS